MLKSRLNYTDSVPPLGRILPLLLRLRRRLCICSPRRGVRGGDIEVCRIQKNAPSVKAKTLNSTL